MKGKRLAWLALLALALFFIVTQPVEAATITREVAEGTARAATGIAEALTTFLTTLF